MSTNSRFNRPNVLVEIPDLDPPLYLKRPSVNAARKYEREYREARIASETAKTDGDLIAAAANELAMSQAIESLVWSLAVEHDGSQAFASVEHMFEADVDIYNTLAMKTVELLSAIAAGTKGNASGEAEIQETMPTPTLSASPTTSVSS